MKIRIFFLLFFCLCSVEAWSHEIRPAYLQIVQKDKSTYHVFWKIPSRGDAVPKIQPIFPSEFEVETLKSPNQIQNAVIYSYKISSSKTLHGKLLGIKGLNKTMIDVLVNITYLNGEKVNHDASTR